MRPKCARTTGAGFHDILPWRYWTTSGISRTTTDTTRTLCARAPVRWRTAARRSAALRAHRYRAVDLRANADRHGGNAGAVGALHRRQPGARAQDFNATEATG